MNAAKITQTFSGLVTWHIAGRYFKLLAAPAAVTVELFRDGQKVLQVLNADAGYYQRIAFDRVQITNPASQEISWLFAPEEGGVDRLVGEVSIADASKARSLAGAAFLGEVGLAGVAGQAPYIQLKMPAASSKRALVRQIIFATDLAGQVALYPHDADLPNSGTSANCKDVGVAGSVAELRWDRTAAAVVTTNRFVRELAVANTTGPAIVFSEPIVIRPGKGILLTHSTLGAWFVAAYEFFEELNQ